MKPFELTPSPFHDYVSLPAYGRQDVGVSPGGAMDRFAFLSANRLLENPDSAECLEFILPPELTFTTTGCGILTGAPYEHAYLLRDQKKHSIKHGVVFAAKKGDQLVLENRQQGLRTILGWRPLCAFKSWRLAGKSRGDFSSVAAWPSADQNIRVIKGPEFQCLENTESFFNETWKISLDSSDMGLRLLSPDVQLQLNMGNMISAPVSDGTVQLTPKGPIVLLRHRQTVGGYPRIFNVIDSDVDLLGQYRPGQLIHFSPVSIDEAFDIKAQYNRDLERLKKL